ncbi:MAG: hypothetical protein AB7V46_10600 [Thermomicrobiales bacterium]
MAPKGRFSQGREYRESGTKAGVGSRPGVTDPKDLEPMEPPASDEETASYGDQTAYGGISSSESKQPAEEGTMDAAAEIVDHSKDQAGSDKEGADIAQRDESERRHGLHESGEGSMKSAG